MLKPFFKLNFLNLGTTFAIFGRIEANTSMSTGGMSGPSKGEMNSGPNTPCHNWAQYFPN